MTQRSFFWNGVMVGDALTYTEGKGYHASVSTHESPLHDRMIRALWNGTGNRGVLPDWNNELEVTGAATPITIDSGAAIVYGLYYENTTSITKAITTPTANARYDRVVVRRDWATQTARIHVITGVENSPTRPNLRQSPRTVYDIPLATLMVETDGTITITSDDREYCTPSTTMTTTTNTFNTTNIANNSIALTQRATRRKKLFFGGGDLIPNVVSGSTSYSTISTGSALQSPLNWGMMALLSHSGPPEWGGDADAQGWKMALGTSGGVCVSFRLPGDYVDNNTISSYIWWVNNATTSTSASLRSLYHVYYDRLGYVYNEWIGLTSDLTTTSISASTKNVVYRTPGASLLYYPSGMPRRDQTRIINYYVAASSLTGSESINILGIEFVYPGYV